MYVFIYLLDIFYRAAASDLFVFQTSWPIQKIHEHPARNGKADGLSQVIF